MANILEKYGIKEVADVTFYSIENGKIGAPVLYLDTLKVSTIEQTAETADAKGGKGNPPLITWDYGKEITVTLEDALFSAKSMAIMFGNGSVGTCETITKTVQFTGVTAPTQWEDAKGVKHNINNGVVYDATGSTVETAQRSEGQSYFITFDVPVSGGVIEIGANTFPGTYYVTGDTYARSAVSGNDEYFQFIINKAKVTAENTITLEAEGDPSVFNLNLKVLRPDDATKPMMQLVKYDVAQG